MKSKTLTLLLLSMLIMPLSSCEEKSNNELTSEIDSSSKEEIESKDKLEILYNKNKDVLDEYYFKYHSAYNKSLFSGPNYAKKFMKQYFVGIDDRIYDFQSAFFGFATPYGHFDMLIANCKTEEQAIEYQSFLNNHYADRFYTRNGTLVYQECQIPYLILYGKPLEKDGYLYYELENGETILFGDVCNCESGIRNQDKVTKIPDWVDIIGGAPTEGLWDDHNPNAELLIIPDSVKEIKSFAFSVSPYKHIILPNNLEAIHACAFYMFNLEYVVIPKSVTFIGMEAFSSGNIFCEAKSKPSGWDDRFAFYKAKVYYADEWEYDENGVPQIK